MTCRVATRIDYEVDGRDPYERIKELQAKVEALQQLNDRYARLIAGVPEDEA